jgi:hypothetical protein
MKSRFTLVALLALGLGFTACEDAFNEKDAIEAQKELLNLKHEHNTALKQLEHANKLAQEAYNDSLTRVGGAILYNRAYTVVAKDLATNAPLADASVMVTSSKGQAITVKTNASGIAVFDNLQIYAGSQFVVTKDGYAATSIAASTTPMNVSLWNTSAAKNEVKGTIYIDTDLTNKVTEVAPVGTLVVASVSVSNGNTSYTVQIPTETTDGGAYSLKLPDISSSSSYFITLPQIVADQKLYVNYTQDDVVTTFPDALPRIATMKTYFNFGGNSAAFTNPSVPYYFMFDADTKGNVAYATPNYVETDPTTGSNQYKLTYVNVNTPVGKNKVTSFTYKPNSTVAVTLVDFAGQFIVNAPRLVATTDTTGKITNMVLSFATDAEGKLVAGAEGTFKNDPSTDTASDFVKNTVTSPQDASTVYSGISYYFDERGYQLTNLDVSPNAINGGKLVVRNFTFKQGSFREKIAN